MNGSTSDLDALLVQPLKASGLVDGPAVELARAHLAQHGGVLGDVLLDLELVREADFLRVFADQHSLRFVKAEKMKTLPLGAELSDVLGARTAERLRACPIHWDASSRELQVVAAPPLLPTLEGELRRLLHLHQVSIHLATPGVVAALIRRAYYRETDAFSHVSRNGAAPRLLRNASADDETGPAERTTISKNPLAGDTSDSGAVPTLQIDPSANDTISSMPAVVVPSERAAGSNDTATTMAALRRENARYRIAHEFHRRVSLERSVEAMVDRILSVIFELLAADGAAVWLTSGQYASKAKEGNRRIEVPRAVIDQTLKSANGLLTHNALVDQRFDHSKSVMVRGIKSVMTVPLRARAGVIGILYVESVSMSAAFTEDDLPLLESIGAQAGILLDNAALVAQVQKEVETRASLSRFLSQAAVEEVLSGRLTLNMEGHAQDITVLFADLRGFTAMSAHMRPEEVVRFLNAFFTDAVDSVERHGGIIDKFIGDCVMGVWGAVKQRPDDARNAIQAALEIVERARRVEVHGAPLSLGVGVNSGSAIVGAIGGRKRSDYTCIGATVNLAARLCGIAAPGDVLITAETLMHAGPGVVSEAREAVVLKGLATPIVPYRVVTQQQPLQLNQPVRAPAPSAPRKA